MHGLFRTLEHTGLVSQDVATGRYSLGPGVLQLGNAYLAGSELRARSMLRAGALALQVNEAVWVSVLVDEAVMAALTTSSGPTTRCRSWRRAPPSRGTPAPSGTRSVPRFLTTSSTTCWPSRCVP